MKVRDTPITGAFLIDLEPNSDERGFFSRLFCSEEFAKKGLNPQIAQINNSHSRYAKTLRGMHYQLPPFEETKLVRCLQGALFDVMCDLRPDSPSFKQWFGAVLTAESRTMMYVPKGCAHGFLTLTDNTEIIYFVSEAYSKTHERGLRYDDPSFNIQWPYPPAVISERDLNHPNFTLEVSCAF